MTLLEKPAWYYVGPVHNEHESLVVAIPLTGLPGRLICPPPSAVKTFTRHADIQAVIVPLGRPCRVFDLVSPHQREPAPELDPAEGPYRLLATEAQLRKLFPQTVPADMPTVKWTRNAGTLELWVRHGRAPYYGLVEYECALNGALVDGVDFFAVHDFGVSQGDRSGVRLVRRAR